MRRTLLWIWTATLCASLSGCGGDGENATQDPPKKNSADASSPTGGPATANDGPIEQPLNIPYVCDEFFAAIVVRPQQILQSKLLPLATLEQLFTHEELALDVRQVELAVVLVEMDTTSLDPRPAAWGSLVRMTEPIDVTRILSTALKTDDFSAHEATHGGKTYYRLPDVRDVCIHMPDDRTALVGDEPTLKRMLDVEKPQGPLAKQLAKVDLKNDLTVCVVAEPIRSLIVETAEKLKGEGASQADDPFAALPHLQSAMLTVNVGGDPLAKLVVDADDAKWASQVQAGIVEMVLPLAKLVLAQAHFGMEDDAPSELGKAISLGEDALDATNVTLDGSRVIVSVARPKGLEQLPELLNVLIPWVDAEQ